MKSTTAIAKNLSHSGRAATPPSRPDFPYVMRLVDGRTVCVEVPGKWVTTDRSGVIAFKPEAVALLDRIRAAFLSTLGRAPSPGQLLRLRESLGVTQRELGERIGVDKMTISRWERGVMRPNATALRALERVRSDALERGIAVDA